MDMHCGQQLLPIIPCLRAPNHAAQVQHRHRNNQYPSLHIVLLPIALTDEH
jgi:hypothetical protein